MKQDGRLENVTKLGTKNPNYGKNEREGQDAKRNCSKVQKSSTQEGETGATRMLQTVMWGSVSLLLSGAGVVTCALFRGNSGTRYPAPTPAPVFNVPWVDKRSRVSTRPHGEPVRHFFVVIIAVNHFTLPLVGFVGVGCGCPCWCRRHVVRPVLDQQLFFSFFLS